MTKAGATRAPTDVLSACASPNEGVLPKGDVGNCILIKTRSQLRAKAMDASVRLKRATVCATKPSNLFEQEKNLKRQPGAKSTRNHTKNEKIKLRLNFPVKSFARSRAHRRCAPLAALGVARFWYRQPPA